VDFARIGNPGEEIPVVRTGPDAEWRDLRPASDDVTPSFFATGGPSAARTALANDLLPPASPDGRFGPPLTGMGKIVCIGLNYLDHARETGAHPPAEPVVFLKTPDTVVGAHDEVLIPRRSTKTDYEVELAVIIGVEARYLGSEADADEVIAGYAISNDVSEREFQIERGGQWDKGKNCETFNPLGPWIRSADSIGDVQDLRLRTWVNGDLRQDGSTSKMIFSVRHLVWYLSQFMVLRPGDVINTGTPAGVALGQPAYGYLSTGDVVELEIDGLGRQRQTFGAA
jgi:2-keto-4-pentenoate hydratase/2-oxohepta-3-ene-1,7-dioic acid hydratase in catechol pathway